MQVKLQSRENVSKALDLDKALVEAAKEIEFNCAEFQPGEEIKKGIAEVATLVLVLVALIGFAVVCWDVVGHV
jgi:hypothetical protein